jgi:hypothetical protein
MAARSANSNVALSDFGQRERRAFGYRHAAPAG